MPEKLSHDDCSNTKPITFSKTNRKLLVKRTGNGADGRTDDEDSVSGAMFYSIKTQKVIAYRWRGADLTADPGVKRTVDWK